MVVYREDYDSCSAECAQTGQEGARCCILKCCFNRLNIFGEKPSTTVNAKALATSFIMSVADPDAWGDKIGCVVEQCVSNNVREPPADKGSDDYKNYWDCFEDIPMYFYDIVDCAYDYNL
jgi:hypothetical protein